MKSLSESLFKKLAGDKAYQRGVAYYNEGRVGTLNIKHGRVKAQVIGSETYDVQLQHTAKQFDGSCNCPASDNFDFCKHCVAVALSYYYQTQTNQELAEEKPQDKIRGYLNTLTKPQLVEALHAMLLQDSTAHEHWQLKAEVASGGLSAAEIRKRITKAIPYKPSGLWRYREVAAYFDRCESTLSVLEDALLALEPSAAHKLIVYAAQRLEKTLETIDDSGGYRFAVEYLLRKWSSELFASAAWGLKPKAKRMVELIVNRQYSYDVFDLPNSAAEAVGEEGLKRVYASLEEHWLKLNPPQARFGDEYFFYARLERLLVARAQDQNNLDKEFRILERAATSVRRCLELVELSIEHSRFDDAEKWLAHAEQLREHEPREQTELATARIALWKAQGKYKLALDAEWARFTETLSADTLQTLSHTAAHLNAQDEWLEKGIGLAESSFAAGNKTRQRINNMIDIYLNHERVERAIELSRELKLDQHALLRIIEASELINDYTFALVERAVSETLSYADNRSYDEAVGILQKLQPKLSEANPERFQQAVLNVYNQPGNKRKPNFVKRLKAAYPKVFD